MTGTNAEKAHYKRIQRARRVAEGMTRCEVWLEPHLLATVDRFAKSQGNRAEAIKCIIWNIERLEDNDTFEGDLTDLVTAVTPQDTPLMRATSVTRADGVS